MTAPGRWDPCISHYGIAAHAFIKEYFGGSDRVVAFVAGAGFDPRSVEVAKALALHARNVHAVLIREERPEPQTRLVEDARKHLAELTKLLPNHAVRAVSIFGPDNAVVGGRNAVSAISELSLIGVTDVVVDISALSVGTYFPMLRFLVARASKSECKLNLHVFAARQPTVDHSITPIVGDAAGCVHGFRGGWGLDETARAAKLWLPQLAKERRVALQRIHDFVNPHDTCPILPFPSLQARQSDELSEHYLTEFENRWAIDARNIVHAHEDDPVDLYRTILRIADLRRPVFAECGGSLLVLSPMGSKVLSLGALLAALERDLPVVYLEAVGYEFATESIDSQGGANLLHLWLEGDAYPASRAAIT